MTPIVQTFQAHVSSVRKLMGFDREVLEIAIANVRELREKLVQHHKLDNPQLTAQRTLDILEGIRDHDSLRPRYQTIFNQALVLVVSYFASSVHDLLRRGIGHALEAQPEPPVLREEFRLTLRDLKDFDFVVREVAPDFLIQSKDISFQDMQSIARAFKTYLEIEIRKDQAVNDIILGQACRHVIVHAGGVVSDQTVRQVSGAKPRRVKMTLISGDVVQFVPEEVELIAESMTGYLQSVSKMVGDKFGVQV